VKPALTREDFMRHVIQDPSGCWLWRGDGSRYGRIGVEAAHRASWELHQGPIPEGMVLLHGCSAFRDDGSDVRGCVNPAHLRPGTLAENAQDTVRVQARRPKPAVDSLDGAPAKHVHLKWNEWELERIARLARDDGIPMTAFVRRLVRQQLLEGDGGG
jgi:hypothetical protein